MLVLGVDPGLTRCGLAVVEGAPGRPVTRARGRRGRHRSGRRRSSTGCGRIADELERVDRASTVPTPSPSSGSSASTTSARSWAPRRPPAVAMLVAGRAGVPGHHLHARARSRPPSPAAAAPTRPRSPRWSPGCCGSTRRRSPADAADALALGICHLWRGVTVGRRRRRRGRSRRGGAPMIAYRQRPGRAASSPGGAVIEVGGVGYRRAVHAGHARRAAPRCEAPRPDRAGRPRGLADAVRLRRRRRARRVRAAADRERRRAEGRAGDARGARPGRRCVAPSRPRTSPR